MTHNAENLLKQRAAIKQDVAACETQLDMLVARPDQGFGGLAELAALVRHRKRLSEVEDKLWSLGVSPA